MSSGAGKKKTVNLKIKKCINVYIYLNQFNIETHLIPITLMAKRLGVHWENLCILCPRQEAPQYFAATAEIICRTF